MLSDNHPLILQRMREQVTDEIRPLAEARRWILALVAHTFPWYFSVKADHLYFTPRLFYFAASQRAAFLSYRKGNYASNKQTNKQATYPEIL